MLRFGNILKASNSNQIQIDEVYPEPVLSKFIFQRKVRKWSSYIDKYFLFKTRLRNFLNEPYDLIHIIDQSNAIYLNEIKKYSQIISLITCHDLIAIRQSKGEFKNAPTLSITGKLLQNTIYQSLSLADYYACDSRLTQMDLNRLIPTSKKKSEIVNLDTDLMKIENKGKISNNFIKCDISRQNFILHVGNAGWYKNRIAVFRAFIKAKQKFKDLKLILIGPKPQNNEIDDNLGPWIRKNNQEIIALENISDDELINLYKKAKVLLFPSLVEGFGWPPLEAAMFGCQVITSKTGAIYELLGNSAIYVKANDQESICRALIDVLSIKEKKICKENLITSKTCIATYIKLYKKIINDYLT